jgi:predicted transcriptional regulator of viral defense system
MPSTRAFSLYLGELDQPVITEYQISVFLYTIYKDKKYKDEIIKTTAKYASRVILRNKLKHLLAIGLIYQHSNFPANKVFNITGKKNYDSGDVVCSVDPFAYLSHLSAMSYHGLTDRIPSTLFITRPNSNDWTKFALQRMEKDLDGDLEIYLQYALPKLIKYNIVKIGRMPVSIYSSIHLGAFKTIRGRSQRVSTIGRTFLDMVRQPHLCGGMAHVIDVYKEHGKKYKVLIIDELERHGKDIEKARVGYLLESAANITDEKIDKWAQFVQRGGSRKLDPDNEFESRYSERWCISLNVPESNSE